MKTLNSSLDSQSNGISRRNFLRGLGACIALPAFTSFAPGRLFAADPALQLATTATGAPLRTAFVSFPNGAIPLRWWPEGGLTDFRFNPTLQPLDIWLAILAGHATRCALSVMRFNQGKWRNIAVLVGHKT